MMFWGSSSFAQEIDALQKSIKAYGSRATTRLTLKMAIEISNNVAELSGRTPKAMVFKASTLSSAESSLSLPKASSSESMNIDTANHDGENSDGENSDGGHSEYSNFMRNVSRSMDMSCSMTIDSDNDYVHYNDNDNVHYNADGSSD